MVTPGYLIVTSSYLVVVSAYLIASIGYFLLLPITSQRPHYVVSTSIWGRYYVDVSKTKFQQISISFPCIFSM